MSDTKGGLKYSLNISDKCEGCGICCVRYMDYFEELDDGRAKAKNKVVVLSGEEVEKIVQLCPCGAISCEESKKNTKQQFMRLLETLETYRAKYPEKKQLAFRSDEYFISIPFASGENRYDYSSDSAANNAAGREFNNKMFSQINVYILKILTEYRIKYMKPYYSEREDENSYYVKCNKELSQILSEAADLLKSEGLGGSIPADFSKVAVFPNDDLVWKMLCNGEVMSSEMVSAIRSEYDSGPCSSVNDYECYWDTDYTEVYAGTSFGRDKYKDKYCYSNMREAFQELARDILSACHYRDDEIEERAIDLLKGIIDVYNQKLKNVLAPKISYMKKMAGQLAD